ncbi:AAA family ATPase [Shimia biformata]|uniref:AAA family ATPase n=1 Tax=Shimia biformata TaxID=1294299 RepID=UPI00194ECD39|nr:AAA family ATPase [Shimia biformata]
MTKPHAIALLTDNAEIGKRFSEILTSSDQYELHRFESGLSALNGQAQEIAATHDFVLFDASSHDDLEVVAAKQLCADQKTKKPLIAITTGDTTLTEIRRLTDAGVTEVLPDSITPEELTSALARLSAKNAETSTTHAAGPMIRHGSIISVAKARGGVGATTLAVNLADRLMGHSGVFRKTAKKSVVVVDLDLQFGNVASFLDQGAGEALYSMAVDGIVPDETYLEQALSVTPSGLAALTAPNRFAPMNALKSAQIEALLTSLRQKFDYVVVDMPPAMVEWITPVLALSDKMLLVTDCSVPSVSKARQVIDFFVEDHLSLPIDIVVSFEHKPMLLSSQHKEAATVLERPLAHWLPNDPTASREALDLGVPLSEAARRSKLTRAIGKLATTLSAEMAETMSATQSAH